MKLRLVRKTYTDESTIGDLLINDELYCKTLEDRVRQPGVKVPGVTAIPSGVYQVIVTPSPRFKCLMPLLINVPQFEGIRIHWGNKAMDTDGCILVGKTEAKDFIGQSREQYADLFDKIQAALNAKEHVTIEIVDTFSEPATAEHAPVSAPKGKK